MPPKPVILAFDTSAAHCAAALLSNDQITTKVDPMSRGQAEHLMPMLERLLGEAGLVWGDLSAIGVGIGPGNFTGIRISVAAARGLALGLGRPAIGVSGFEVIKYCHPTADWAIIPAPREMAYIMGTDGHPSLQPQIDLPTLAGIKADATMIDPHQSITAIARLTGERFGTPQPRPAPMYVRAADAAPASDPPPMILP